mmetsp:Transcript_49538/g.138690  ORF Transcript_49538/g.138690 Transcript_49538/m.138690 type:complete len:586 (-) Transcript_49538:108-1865(-)
MADGDIPEQVPPVRRARSFADVELRSSGTLASMREFVKSREPPPDASEGRKRVAKIFKSVGAELTLGAVVTFNMVLVCLEANALADHGVVPFWINVSVKVLMLVYVVELALRIYIFRFAFFVDAWNVMDIVIVGADVFGEVVGALMHKAAPPIGVLRLLVLLRVARTLGVFESFPELHLLVRGLGSAVKAIVWGAVLVAVIMAMWSIAAVRLIHPYNIKIAESGYYEAIGCERCPRAFESVGQAMLTIFQQIVAGDSWGQLSLPIIESYPWTAFYFVGVLVSVGLALLNLMLAVIVEKAAEAQVATVAEQSHKKEIQRLQAGEELVKLCCQLDRDGSGHISRKELHDGFKEHKHFKDQMTMMDITQDDVDVVFNILDTDRSGTNEYVEFVDELNNLRSRDAHTILVFLKHYVSDIHMKIQEQARERKISDPPKFGKFSEHADRTSVNPSVPTSSFVDKQPSIEGPAPHQQDYTETKQKTPTAFPSVEAASSSQDLNRLFAVSEELLQAMKEVATQSQIQAMHLESLTGLLSTTPGAPLTAGQKLGGSEESSSGTRHASQSPCGCVTLSSDAVTSSSVAKRPAYAE